MSNRFSGKVRVFHGLRLPEKAVPAGYAAVIDAYALAVPLPYRMCCIGESHTMKETKGPDLLKLRETPGAIFTLRKNRMGIFLPHFVVFLLLLEKKR